MGKQMFPEDEADVSSCGNKRGLCTRLLWLYFLLFLELMSDDLWFYILECVRVYVRLKEQRVPVTVVKVYFRC